MKKSDESSEPSLRGLTDFIKVSQSFPEAQLGSTSGSAYSLDSHQIFLFFCLNIERNVVSRCDANITISSLHINTEGICLQTSRLKGTITCKNVMRAGLRNKKEEGDWFEQWNALLNIYLQWSLCWGNFYAEYMNGHMLSMDLWVNDVASWETLQQTNHKACSGTLNWPLRHVNSY